MENFKAKRGEWGQHLLRLGLSCVFLWFGFSQLFDSLNWVYLVPEWASNLFHLPPALIVLGNGLMEVVLGTVLAMGFFVPLIALVLGLHLIPIMLDLGWSAIGVRDFGLITALFSLALIYKKKEVPPQIVSGS